METGKKRADLGGGSAGVAVVDRFLKPCERLRDLASRGMYLGDLKGGIGGKFGKKSRKLSCRVGSAPGGLVNDRQRPRLPRTVIGFARGLGKCLIGPSLTKQDQGQVSAEIDPFRSNLESASRGGLGLVKPARLEICNGRRGPGRRAERIDRSRNGASLECDLKTTETASDNGPGDQYVYTLGCKSQRPVGGPSGLDKVGVSIPLAYG